MYYVFTKNKSKEIKMIAEKDGHLKQGTVNIEPAKWKLLIFKIPVKLLYPANYFLQNTDQNLPAPNQLYKRIIEE